MNMVECAFNSIDSRKIPTQLADEYNHLSHTYYNLRHELLFKSQNNISISGNINQLSMELNRFLIKLNEQ